MSPFFKTSIFLILFAGGFLYFARIYKRPMKKLRLRRIISREIKQARRHCNFRKKIGLGNVGMVVTARLSEGWENELGIRWRSAPDSELQDEVAVKFSVFKSPEKRLETLIRLGKTMEKNMNQENPAPLCPFLALGLIKTAGEGIPVVTEVMPLVPGRGLDQLLKKERLNPAKTLEQLIAILHTVPFLENLGFYSRNLDAENIVVTPEGKWIRIDYDNAVPCKKYPLRVMLRLVRLTGKVLRNFPRQNRTELWKSVMHKISETEKAPLKQHSLESLPGYWKERIFLSPMDLIDQITILRTDFISSLR